MTVKNAIKILDFVIQNKTKMKEGFLKKDWGKESMVLGVVSSVLKCIDTDLYNLEVIKKQLVPDCKHPKEDIDLDPETKKPYCMACNWDL